MENVPPDELHCTCVPALRGEIWRLKAELEEMESFKARYFSKVEGTRYSQIIELEQSNKRLQQENATLRERLDVENILKAILKHLQERKEQGKPWLGTFWQDIAKTIAKGKE